MSSTGTQSSQDYPSKPSLNTDGTLVIPHDCDPKYHYWKGGQTVLKTLEELNAPPEIMRKYKREENV